MSQLAMAVSWWFVLQLFGVAVLPLTLRLFQNLPDRGWAFARPVGLLAVGYLFWLGCTFGVMSNTWGSILGSILVVATASWLIGWRQVVGLPDFLRAQRPRLLAVEVVFTLAFLIWTFVRAHNPEISATEKPMELAFLNGVLRSEQFPPLDPWLSGYAISYYYFGYVITGMVARLAGVPAQVAFNLMIPTLFALTATGAYALGSNLYAGRARLELPGALRRTIASGVLSIVMVLCLANLEPVLEIMNAHNALSPEAHAYFSIKDMPQGYVSGSLFPTDPPDGWWWFRATRVVGTQAAEGTRGAVDYTINEFPFFSFILGDMHPHVLALPFVLVALGFALNLLRTPGELTLASLRRDPLMVGAIAVLYGALGFLNAWDLPTFLFVLAGAFAIHRLLSTGELNRAVVRDVLYGFPGALILGLLVYLPFYLAFRSQASGLGVVVTHTQLRHFALFWGPLYLAIGSFLVHQLVATWRLGPADWTRSPFTWIGVAAIAAVGFVLEAPVIGMTVPMLAAALALASRCLLGVGYQVSGVGESDESLVSRSRARPSIAALAAEGAPAPSTQHPTPIAGGALPLAWPREHLFALLLAFTGMLLIFGCELVFIRDLFGNRMNTVFKLYYQAWACLAIAATYALPFMFERLRRHPLGIAWSTVVAIVLGLALLYPIGATLSKTRNFAGPPTLDGLQFWARSRPDDMDAIEWLGRNAVGAPVIVEASGGSYQQQFGRVASMTGLPTLLGWAFHEQQWRGTFEEQGRRQPDIDAIYGCRRAGQGRCDPAPGDAKQLQALLDKYDVTYVVIGPSEREAYGQVDLSRFNQAMDLVYKNNAVSIYRNRARSA